MYFTAMYSLCLYHKRFLS